MTVIIVLLLTTLVILCLAGIRARRTLDKLAVWSPVAFWLLYIWSVAVAYWIGFHVVGLGFGI